MSGNRSVAVPDCKTCLYAQECEKAQAGRFYTRWRSTAGAQSRRWCESRMVCRRTVTVVT